MHYRRALGVLVVYDITNEQTFLSLKDWIKCVKEQAELNVSIIIVGNKLDIVQANAELRQVSLEQGQQFAQEQNALFMETSAVENINVTEAFHALVEEIYRKPFNFGPHTQ